MDFSKKTAVIVSHVGMFGPPHELRDYLLTHKVKKLLFIGHSNKAMHDNAIKASFYEYYYKGTCVKRYESKLRNLPEFLGYIVDFFQTIFFTAFTLKGTADYYIGLGNINAFSGLFLKTIGCTKSVYYYVIDYIPNRFENVIINYVYHFIEMLSALLSDQTWNYAKAMILEREKHWNRKFPHQTVVPNGIHIRPSTVSNFESIHKHELIYLGTLSKQQGIHVVLDALPFIIKHIPDIHFSLIGKGSYRNQLEKKIRILGIAKYVTFLGFIDDPIEVDKRLGKGAVGVAMYDPELSFVIYTEPGKVKRYLSVGVPVIMTDVSPIAVSLEKKSCGFVCPYDKNMFAETVVRFIKDEEQMKVYRKNALTFVKNATWEEIFTKAFAFTS